MNFRIVLHGELGKRVAVGILDEQELAALSAALNDGLCLVGVQKHGVLVAAGQVFPLVDAVRLILTVVVGHTSIYVLIPCGDLLGGDRGQRDFIPGRAVEIIAENFLRPFVRIRFNVPPRTIGIVGPEACPMMIGTVVDALAAMSSESRKHVCCVNVRIGQHLQNSGVVCHWRIGREFIRQHLCRHRDKDRIHGDTLCRQFFL